MKCALFDRLVAIYLTLLSNREGSRQSYFIDVPSNYININDIIDPL